MKNITENDIEKKARKAGIDMRVTVESALLDKLAPSPFLSSLGVSIDRRLENLFGLVKASLTVKEKTGDSIDDRHYIPFIIVKGPFIKEDMLPVIVQFNREEGGDTSITLTQAIDDESGTA
jgi:hypothetical protein